MIKIVKWLLTAFVVLAVIIVVGGLFISPSFKAEASAQIDAPPEKIYPLIADPRRWKEWSAWNQRDPAMQVSYSGPPSGAGAGWSWKSRGEGDGQMTFTAADPGRRVAYDLYFPDFGTTSKGDFTLAPANGGTRVTWTLNGDMGGNPVFRWFALFADGMVRKDFDAGLANLKALAEKP